MSIVAGVCSQGGKVDDLTVIVAQVDEEDVPQEQPVEKEQPNEEEATAA